MKLPRLTKPILGGLEDLGGGGLEDWFKGHGSEWHVNASFFQVTFLESRPVTYYRPFCDLKPGDQQVTWKQVVEIVESLETNNSAWTWICSRDTK